LLIFGREKETVVVEADFSVGYGVVGGFGGKGEVFEGGEEGAGTAGVLVKMFC
jgi:hypothetical protein